MPDVSKDPRYIKVVDDARSELVIPLMLKDRCIGVFDLESPELDAFTKNHVEILTLLASQAAVAIENARLYETILANEVRLEKGDPFRTACPGGAAARPELPKRLKGVDGCGEVRSRTRSRGRPVRLPRPRAEQSGRRRRRRVGKGRSSGALQRVRRGADSIAHVPPALRAGAVHAGGSPGVDQHDPARTPARGVLLHGLLRALRFQAAKPDDGQFRPAVSDPLQRRYRGADRPPGRAARFLCRIDLRRADVRSDGRRPVRVLHGRRVQKPTTRSAASSAPIACWTSVRAERQQVRLAKWSTPFSRPCTTSVATRRPTTT